MKLHPDVEDPVPEYTLVSGLPSYEAALELLQKSPQSSCLIVYPSVFNVFNKQERSSQELQHPGVATSAPPAAPENHLAPQTPSFCDATMPLLPATTAAAATHAAATVTAVTAATATSATLAASPTCESIKPNFVMMPIVPSYAEVFGSSYKTVDEKKKSKSKDSQSKDDIKR